MKELLELEERGWQALSTSAEAARAFYRDLLRDDAVMIFPGGILLEGKAAILDSFAAQPWADFELGDSKSVNLASDAVALIYKATATREGSPAYTALIHSTYTQLNGSWKLTVHQHTPV